MDFSNVYKIKTLYNVYNKNNICISRVSFILNYNISIVFTY